MSTHKTPKGTELPVMNLRGKDYLEVKYRLVWFREEHPDWSIETEFIARTQDAAIAKATIRNAAGGVMSTSHKYEDAKGFGDFLEKAETGAIGRALALVGYGTQFCGDDLDEGSRIVDSPAKRTAPASSRALAPDPLKLRPALSAAPPPFLEDGPPPYEDHPPAPPAAKNGSVFNPRDYVVKFGKFSGKRLGSINPADVANYVDYLRQGAERSGEPLSGQAKEFVQMVEAIK